jgi:hypothetical protein
LPTPSELTPHERRVLALCASLLDWCPGPTARSAESRAQPGAKAAERIDCPACNGVGRKRGRGGFFFNCERCRGAGRLLVDGYTRREIVKDERQLPIDEEIRAHFDDVNADSSTRGAKRVAERDRGWTEAARLQARLEGESEPEYENDLLQRILDSDAKRTAQYEAGDYAAVDQALKLYRHVHPQAYDWFWRFAILSDAAFRSPWRPVEQLLAECVRWLAPRVPEPAKVPAWLEPKPTRAKESLWHGRRPAHERQREARDFEIRARLARGAGAEELADIYGLTARRVRQIGRRRDMTGPAAA